ncbi:hypothetical protein [Desulfosudis oleivorans]|nr:hypothetical protein [Desulfosudis oleivorans]
MNQDKINPKSSVPVAAIIVAAIIAIASLIGWYMYLQNSRFSITPTDKGPAYEIDRKTGESWVLYPGSRKKNEMKNNEKETGRFKRLPSVEQAKISATMMRESGNKFTVRLYNGSTWTIKEITIGIETKDLKAASGEEIEKVDPNASEFDKKWKEMMATIAQERATQQPQAPAMEPPQQEQRVLQEEKTNPVRSFATITPQTIGTFEIETFIEYDNNYEWYIKEVYGIPQK